MGSIFARCSRDASSGTTPPYGRCKSICEAITDERISLPSRTTEAAVSSQDVSIPRMITLLILFSVNRKPKSAQRRNALNVSHSVQGILMLSYVEQPSKRTYYLNQRRM